MQAAPDAGRTAVGLAYVCTHWDELHSLLGDNRTDPTTVLQRLAGIAESGSAVEIAAALDAVHHALRACGDARGVYENQRDAAVAGVHRLEIVYRCPFSRCTGLPAHEVRVDRPHCALTGRELVRERLS
ncbi:hypothetical protein [Nocardia sp. NPDC058705]|uniref:hypothetical protein n=1 Tax=Nocardia sp. NPDC058705 TaxID=3346609 RepID=UPI0036B1EBF2